MKEVMLSRETQVQIVKPRSPKKVALSDEELDKVISVLRSNGYRYMSTVMCRAALFNEDFQFSFMNGSVQVLDMKENRLYKVKWGEGASLIEKEGELMFDLDLDKGVEL